MFLEPQRTQYDFNFQVLGIPVRVSPWFWGVSMMMGARSGASAQDVLVWVAVVFFSILIHEMGHALVIRYYGWTPRIVLYGFGGLAIYDPTIAPWQPGRRVRRTSAQQIMISLAGPGTQIILAAIVMALLATSNRSVFLPFAGLISSEPTPEALQGFPFYGVLGTGPPLSALLQLVVFDLIWVNVFWALLNLLPIYPLDGGQVARELFLASSNDGIRQSLTLSMVTAIGLAIFGLTSEQIFVALMFGYLAYMNYTQLQGPFGGGFGGLGGNRPW